MHEKSLKKMVEKNEFLEFRTLIGGDQWPLGDPLRGPLNHLALSSKAVICADEAEPVAQIQAATRSKSSQTTGCLSVKTALCKHYYYVY